MPGRSLGMHIKVHKLIIKIKPIQLLLYLIVRFTQIQTQA